MICETPFNPLPMRSPFYAQNKFRNIKITIDGIKFDSKKEAARYCELKIMEKAGHISDLKTQPRFELLPSFRRDGVLQRKIEYIADFMYKTKSGVFVEDVKSEMTKSLPVYRMKKKLFLFKYQEIKFLET